MSLFCSGLFGGQSFYLEEEPANSLEEGTFFGGRNGNMKKRSIDWFFFSVRSWYNTQKNRY